MNKIFGNQQARVKPITKQHLLDCGIVALCAVAIGLSGAKWHLLRDSRYAQQSIDSTILLQNYVQEEIDEVKSSEYYGYSNQLTEKVGRYEKTKSHLGDEVVRINNIIEENNHKGKILDYTLMGSGAAILGAAACRSISKRRENDQNLEMEKE